MDLTPYVARLGEELAAAAEAGGEDARALAGRLLGPLDSAVRLTLLEALSSAADEITRELAPGSVEVRLRGREPSFVVTAPPADEFPASPGGPAAGGAPPAGGSAAGGGTAGLSSPAGGGGDDGAMARINVRMPEQLKARIEEAAAREKVSANVWLMRAAAAALDTGAPSDRASRGRIPGQHFTGWVR